MNIHMLKREYHDFSNTECLLFVTHRSLFLHGKAYTVQYTVCVAELKQKTSTSLDTSKNKQNKF